LEINSRAKRKDRPNNKTRRSDRTTSFNGNAERWSGSNEKDVEMNIKRSSLATPKYNRCLGSGFGEA